MPQLDLSMEWPPKAVLRRSSPRPPRVVFHGLPPLAHYHSVSSRFYKYPMHPPASSHGLLTSSRPASFSITSEPALPTYTSVVPATSKVFPGTPFPSKPAFNHTQHTTPSSDSFYSCCYSGTIFSFQVDGVIYTFSLIIVCL